MMSSTFLKSIFPCFIFKKKGRKFVRRQELDSGSASTKGNSSIFPLFPSHPHQGHKECLSCSDKVFAPQLGFKAEHVPAWLYVTSPKEGDTYFSRQHTKKYEDEHPLKRIEDCKQIRSHHRSLYNMKDAEDPGSPKKEQESKSTSGTGPGETLQTTCRHMLFPPLPCLKRGIMPRQLVSAATA